MKNKYLKTALLLATLFAFSPITQAQLMLNIETCEGTNQIKVDDIAQIDFDESSIYVLNFKDKAGTVFNIDLQQYLIIQFNDDWAIILGGDDMLPIVELPSYQLLSTMSLSTIPAGTDSQGNESVVNLSVVENSLFVSLNRQASVDVFAVDGRSIYSNPSAIGDLHIYLQSGIFIVKINDQTFKIKR